MAQQKDFESQFREAERERQREERKKKWAEREKNFWKAFLFTENGRPKSGLMVYTFCLSFVLLGVYLIAFFFAVEELTSLTAGLPVFWGNLIQSLAASAVGMLLGLLLHVVLSDKRLVFGTYLWLVLYAVVCLVTLLMMLRGTGAASSLLTFFGWFVAIPVGTGLAMSYFLYRRDYVPKTEKEEEPEWKKYVQRR